MATKDDTTTDEPNRQTLTLVAPLCESCGFALAGAAVDDEQLCGTCALEEWSA